MSKKAPLIIRSDCFAYLGEHRCDACKIFDCQKCAFCKPKDDLKNTEKMKAFLRNAPIGHGNSIPRIHRTRKPISVVFPDGSTKIYPTGIIAACETGIRQEA
ncbi:MAG: hypothetical protein WC479_06705, partial [Candidatus Izemoplasmatales bacterium]